MIDSTTKPNAELALNNPNQTNQDGPVECLGKTFENDAARQEYYLEILSEKLKDPEFRKIRGFPIGEDDDILNLSDPPYYTACPNPFIEEFIDYYGKPYDPNEKYKREPYAADVSEGKNDPLYNAHTYHTKVPHKAIMQYILHYTVPGDVVFDAFCGTGMTGVAAQLCGNRASVENLGYIFKDGKLALNSDGQSVLLGQRKAILNDLSPIAGFIANGYSNLDNLEGFYLKASQAIDDVEKELESLFTLDSNKVLNGVWSDVFICPNCASEVNYWDHAVSDQGKITKEFNCKKCATLVSKASFKTTGAQKLERMLETKFDSNYSA